MSSHATKLIKKYDLTSDTDIDLLSVYAIELAPYLVDKNSRNLARRRLVLSFFSFLSHLPDLMIDRSCDIT